MRRAAFFVLLIACSSIQATTINVPADQPTIQAGIDAALSGDTVLVADGTYTGVGNRVIDFGGKGIHLKSENGPDLTIINCQNIEGGFYFHSGEDSSAVVDGFTIQGGNGGGWGGIYCLDSDPTIINNIISGNKAEIGGGGGITCHNSNPTICNNTISENTARYGGGVYMEDSNPRLDNNTINGNSALLGGGICCNESDPNISNCTFSGNWSRYSNNAIACVGSNPVITNCILWGNAGSIALRDSISNPAVTFCVIQGGWEGEGNIDLDPLFVGSLNQEICLQSPCIDAGDPSILDLDGSRSDIGRYLSEHPDCSAGNNWHVATTGSDTSGDGSQGNPFRTIQHGIDVSLSSDTVSVASGTYVENLIIWGKSILLTSEYLVSGDTNDIQNTIIDGNLVSSVLKLLGCDSLSVLTGFTIQRGYGWAPFGEITRGGGIFLGNSHPTISNNNISGNSIITLSQSLGGGIYCDHSNPIIINNTISKNGSSFGEGGGICCNAADPTIINNTISENSAILGAGIYTDSSNATIINNTIIGNNSTFGSGIFCDNSNITVTSNTISGNSGSYGSGIYSIRSSPVIRNTIVTFNDSRNRAIWCVDSSPTLICCDIFGNEGGDWVGYIADQAGINGNFSAHPIFCDTAAGDFRLDSYSPCTPGNSVCGELVGSLGVGCDLVCGDIHRDGEVTIADVMFLKEFYLNLGPAPYLYAVLDVDCSGEVNIADIIYLADYLFRDGDPPCCP